MEEGEDDEINDALRELAKEEKIDVIVRPNEETYFRVSEKGLQEFEDMKKDPNKLAMIWGVFWNLMVSQFEKDQDIFAFANAILKAEEKVRISEFITNALQGAKERGIILNWKVRME